MARPTRALPALVLAVSAIGCGGGEEDSADEASLRECLADAGLAIEATASGAPLGGVSPDFRAAEAGLTVDVIVERDSERAERAAADLRGALASFGVSGVERRLIQERNAIAVFSADPDAAQRDEVAGCLAG